MILHNSRIRHKRTQVSGATPTIGPSDDFTDDTWVDNDIYPGEFFLDMGGQVGWFGYSGTTSGVGAWFQPDPTAVTIDGINGIGTEFVTPYFLNVEYTGATIVGDPYQYLVYEDTWVAGSGDLTINIYPTLIPQPTTNTALMLEVKCVFIDTTTFDTATFHFNGRYLDVNYPYRSCLATYDITGLPTWKTYGVGGRYVADPNFQNSIANFAPANGGIIPSGGGIFDNPNLDIVFDVSPGVNPVNDIKFKLHFKYTYLDV
jgi:hypothetical protein